MIKDVIALFILVSFFFSCTNLDDNKPGNETFDQDPRSYQHGVDFVRKSDGNYILIWSSSGINPTGAMSDGEWPHDVYYSNIDINNPVIEPIELISAEWAQEPASSAISNDFTIMVTMEDMFNAKNVLAQTYAVYNEDMNPIKDYQQVVFDGGHSGHVASVGNNFVVFYSEEWVFGGGVDNLGSGDDVMLDTFDSHGNFVHKKAVSVGDQHRDWWPLVSGSNSSAILLWQRFVDDKLKAKLMYSIYDPESNELVVDGIQLVEDTKYYTYDVQYLSNIDCFLVCGAYDEQDGFLFLISSRGEIVSSYRSFTPIVRGAQPAILEVDKKNSLVVYPSSIDKLMVLNVSDLKVDLKKEIPVNYSWLYSGTDGIFLNENTTYFVTLSPDGLKEFTIKIN